ncbi:uncharacterized protein LOC117173399 isoform X2 [Belonocnema kinseyi]|uniref:uncharacterized protein LOC117173399 isoform X2 n=1 Tax=Belonocnema kinseyi TaxID=2817044 RepID=UPI00143D9E28|nr:uncharacterized protein LOC117173399 isoform X2 [Belonocnema kinseyi]
MATLVRRVLGQSTVRLNSLSINLDSRETLNARFRQLRNYSCDMCKAKECPPITVRSAQLSDFDNIVSFMKENFLKHDPACTYLSIPDPPHHALLNHFYENLKDGMALLAVEENHCIVGVVINTAVSHWSANKTIQFADSCLNRPEKDLLKFYAHIAEGPNIWEKYCVAKVFDCTYLAVKPEWQVTVQKLRKTSAGSVYTHCSTIDMSLIKRQYSKT